MGASPVYIDRVAANVGVVGVIGVPGMAVPAVVIVMVAVVVGVVVASVVVVVVVAISVVTVVVVAVAVVAAMPGCVAVIGSAVVVGASAIPVAMPRAIPPPATPAAHHGAHGDACSERQKARRNKIRRAIAGSRDSRPIDDRGVVLRNVYDLRIGRFNNDGLWRLLNHGDLRAGLEIASRLGFGAQGLNGAHHICLLIVVRLSQRGSPGEILRHVVEHGWELCQRLDGGIP